MSNMDSESHKVKQSKKPKTVKALAKEADDLIKDEMKTKKSNIVFREEPKSDMQALILTLIDVLKKNKIAVNTSKGDRLEINKEYVECGRDLPELVSMKGYYNFSLKLRCAVDFSTENAKMKLDALMSDIWEIVRNEKFNIRKYTVIFEGNFPQKDNIGDGTKYRDVIYMLKQKRS